MYSFVETEQQIKYEKQILKVTGQFTDHPKCLIFFL